MRRSRPFSVRMKDTICSCSLVAHGVVAKAIRALVRDDFSDFFDWQLRNGEVLTLKIATEPNVARELAPAGVRSAPL